MQNFLRVIFSLIALCSAPNVFAAAQTTQTPQAEHASTAGNAAIEKAFAQGRSDVQVSGRGTVIKLLADDNEGSRHQKFLVRLPSGLTLLIAHNIDLAPRINKLKVSDSIEFYGEYEWNEQGGVIHWTHKDPAGRHRAGWLQHKGQKYH
jgi:hypothetical protein